MAMEECATARRAGPAALRLRDVSAMFWYDYDLSGWGWFTMTLSMTLFWALIITAAVLAFRALGRTTERDHPAAPSPEQLLAERFARGEIDEDDYHSRLAALHAGGPARRKGPVP